MLGIKRLLISYLCLSLLIPGPVLAQVQAKAAQASAQATASQAQQTASSDSSDESTDEAQKDLAEAPVLQPKPLIDDRRPVLEALLLATWQLRDIVKPTIPGLLEHWKLESYALFEGVAHCGAYFNKQPESFEAVHALLSESQAKLAQFLNGRVDEIGELRFEIASDPPRPPLVKSPRSGRQCQPLARLEQGFYDRSQEQPEQLVKLESLWGRESLASPYFIGLSRKTLSSPLTDTELRNWLGWMAGLRKFAGLYAQFLSQQHAQGRPTLPAFEVDKAVGQKLNRVFEFTENTKAISATQSKNPKTRAHKILRHTLDPGRAPRFEVCKPKLACFRDGKESDSRILDENLLITLQTRDSEHPERVSHGNYLNAMRLLGIKGLLVQLGTAISMLSGPKRNALFESGDVLPQACREASDIQPYRQLFEKQLESGKREWWIQQFLKTIKVLVDSLQSGKREAPHPDFEAARSLYEQGQMLAINAVEEAVSDIQDQSELTADQRQVIEKYREYAMAEFSNEHFALSFSSSQLNYADILSEKLLTQAILSHEQWLEISEKRWENKRAELSGLMQKVVYAALEDALRAFVLRHFSSSELMLLSVGKQWDSRFHPQWQEVLQSDKYKKEIEAISRKLTDAYFASQVGNPAFDRDQFAANEAAVRLEAILPRAAEAALTDIAKARPVSELPTLTGEGTQDPVFPLNPHLPVDHEALRVGLNMIASGHLKQVVEVLESYPGYESDARLASVFRSQVSYGDGTSQTNELKDKASLARLLVKRFGEVTEGDPVKDRDLKKWILDPALDGLEHFLVYRSKRAKRAYDENASEFGHAIKQSFLDPMIEGEAERDASWLAQFRSVLAEVQSRDVIVPRESLNIDDVIVTLTTEPKVRARRIRRLLEQVRPELLSEGLLRGKANGVDGDPLAQHCEKLKEKPEAESCLKWLIPLKEENGDLLKEFYLARVQVGTEQPVTEFLSFFGKDGMAYPGIGKTDSLSALKEAQHVERAVGTVRVLLDRLLKLWHGRVGLQVEDEEGTKKESESAQQLREELDSLLVAISKAAKQEKEKKEAAENEANVSAFALMNQAGFESLSRKHVESWLLRMRQAGGRLRVALETAQQEGPTSTAIQDNFLLFQAVLAFEYRQQLLAAPEVIEANLEKGVGKDVATLLLPDFYEFRNAVLDRVATLRVPHGDIYENIKQAKEGLAVLGYQLDEMAEAGKESPEFIRNTAKRSRHLELQLERNRRLLKTYQELERLLKNYLPKQPEAKRAANALSKPSYSFLWDAYFEDQFLNTTTDLNDQSMAMTPSEILEDLNALGAKRKGLLNVSLQRSKLFLKPLLKYVSTTLESSYVDGMGKRYKLNLTRDLETLLANKKAVASYLAGENDPSIAVSMARLERLYQYGQSGGPAQDIQQVVLRAWANPKTIFAVADQWKKSIGHAWNQWRGTRSEDFRAVLEKLLDADNPNAVRDAFPSYPEFAYRLELETETLLTDINAFEEAEEKDVLWLPAKLNRQYGPIAQIATDVYFHAESNFGPLARWGADSSEIVWFRRAPYLTFGEKLSQRLEVEQEQKRLGRKQKQYKQEQEKRKEQKEEKKEKAQEEKASEKKSGKQKPVRTSEGWVYPTQEGQLKRLLQQIGEREFMVIYRENAEGVPVGVVTHEYIRVEGKGSWIPIEKAAPIERTDRIEIEINDVRFAFRFEGERGVPYAQRGEGQQEWDAVVARDLLIEAEYVEPATPSEIRALVGFLGSDFAPKVYERVFAKEKGLEGLMAKRAEDRLRALWRLESYKQVKAYVAIDSYLLENLRKQYAVLLQRQLVDEDIDSVVTQSQPNAETEQKTKDSEPQPSGSLASSSLSGEREELEWVPLFNSKEAKPLTYEQWIEELVVLLHVWDSLDIGENEALEAALARHIYHLFFDHLAYQWNGWRIVIPGDGIAENNVHAAAFDFENADPSSQRRIVAEINAQVAIESNRAREEVRELLAKEGEEKQRLGIEIDPYEVKTINAFGPGAPVQFVALSGSRRLSGEYQFLQFYARYFAFEENYDSNEMQLWQQYVEKLDSGTDNVFEKDTNEFSFSWVPSNKKTTQKERFAAWVKGLQNDEVIQKDFKARTKTSGGGHIWQLASSLDEFVESELYQQLIVLLERFDENAKASGEPETYPFFLASLNWKINRYGKMRNLGAENPKTGALSDKELAGLMPAVIKAIRLNLKDFDGWEEMMERTGSSVHEAIAYQKRFALVGISERRFSNTSVPTEKTDNPDWGPDFETRFFPVFPRQRSEFLPADSWEEYKTIVDRPAAFLRSRVNDSDRHERPLYKQLVSIQGRMVGVGELHRDAGRPRKSFAQVDGQWHQYRFGNGLGADAVTQQAVRRSAQLRGLEVSPTQINRLVELREQYVDFLEKVSQLIDKYPYETAHNSTIRGSSVLIQSGRFLQRNFRLSHTGRQQLDAMLAAYAVQTHWKGELPSVEEIENKYQVARAIWLAGAMTQAQIERGLSEAEIKRNRTLLLAIDQYFAAYLQREAFQDGMGIAAKNILPKLDQLCQAGWVKGRNSDEDLKKVDSLIKESNILYYDNLAQFINDYLPEGDNNETYRRLIELRHQKTLKRKALEYAGRGVMLLFSIMILRFVAGEGFGGGALFANQHASIALTTLLNLYFGVEIATGWYDDYWGGEARIDYLRGNRDTVVADVVPLVSNKQGFDTDLEEKVLIGHQKSAVKWITRVWMIFFTAQMTGMTYKALGGMHTRAMTRLRPHGVTRAQLKRAAKKVRLDYKTLLEQDPKYAVMEMREAVAKELEAVLGKRIEDIFVLNDSMAVLLRKDIDLQIRAMAKGWKLDPRTMRPLEDGIFGSAKKVSQKVLDARMQGRLAMERLQLLRAQLTPRPGYKPFVTRDDLALLFLGKDTAMLKGMGHPAYRHMPNWLQFTGWPRLFFSMGPSQSKLSKIYKLMTAELEGTNLLTYQQLFKFRRQDAAELRNMVKIFGPELRTQMKVQRDAFFAKKKEIAALYKNGTIDLKRKREMMNYFRESIGLRRDFSSETEELLAAFIDTNHPLYLRFASRNQLPAQVTFSRQEGMTQLNEVLELGGVEGSKVTEEMFAVAERFRKIASAGGIAPDTKVLRAIAQRNYPALAREFLRPDRVLRTTPERMHQALFPELVPKQTGAATPKPAPVRSLGVVELLETRGQAGKYFGKWLKSLEGQISSKGVNTEKVAQWVADKSSIELQQEFAENLALKRLTLGESKTYQTAIAVSRDLELVQLLSAERGGLPMERLVGELTRLRWQSLEKTLSYGEVIPQELTIIEAKSILKMKPDYVQWKRHEILHARGQLEGELEITLLEKAEKQLIGFSTDAEGALSIDDLARLVDLPTQYMEFSPILRLLEGPDLMVKKEWLGRVLEVRAGGRLSKLFGRYDLTSVGEAEGLLGLSRRDSVESIRARASRLREGLRPQANRTPRERLQQFGLEIPESERLYLRAIERVNQAERLLIDGPLGRSAGAVSPPPSPPPSSLPASPPVPVEVKTPALAKAKPAAPSAPVQNDGLAVSLEAGSKHELMGNYVGSGKLYRGGDATAVSKSGFENLELQLVDAEMEGTVTQVQRQRLELARLYKAGDLLNQAKAVGSLTPNEMQPSFYSLLNNYSRGERFLLYPLGVEAYESLLEQYLEDQGFDYEPSDFSSVREIMEIKQLLDDQAKEEDLEANLKRKLQMAQHALSVFHGLSNRFGDRGLGGLEGIAFGSAAQLPLEVLLAPEILNNSELLNFLLSGPAKNASAQVIALQALFAENQPEALRGAIFTASVDPDRVAEDVGRRLRILQKLSESSTTERLITQYQRALERLEKAGIKVPEI